MLKFIEVKDAQSCPTLCDPMDCPWNSPGQNTGVGILSLLQGIFLTQRLNPGLPHCKQILYQLSHKGSVTPSIKNYQPLAHGSLSSVFQVMLIYQKNFNYSEKN